MFSFTARRVAVRSFATSARLNKTVVDTAKDAVKAVDNTVSKAAVAGIEKGGKSAHFSPHSFLSVIHVHQHDHQTDTNMPSVEQLADSAKKATNMSSGEAKGKAHEVAGQAKGKAEEIKGQAKGAAAEVQSKM